MQNDIEIEEDKNYIIKVITTEPNNFKAIFSILKDNDIMEASLKFENTGIEILETDITHTLIAYISLQSDAFSHYFCRTPTRIGVDCVILMKLLKTVGSKDTLTLFVEDKHDMYQELAFGFIIENSEKGQLNKVYCNAIDVQENSYSIPELNYPYSIQMPSSDLQSIATTLKNVSNDKDKDKTNLMKIRFCNDTLRFSAKGSSATSEIIRTPTNREDNSIKIDKNTDNKVIIELNVDIARFVESTKCTQLSNIVTLFLEDDETLYLVYDVGNMGKIKLGLSPATATDD